MKTLKALGEAVALGSILAWIYVLLVTTFNGLSTGNYRVGMLDSNIFLEHYLELLLLVVGLICYVYYRKIRFTLHPKKVN